MAVVSFDVQGAGKVVDANAKINAAIKKGHRDLVTALVKGNRELLTAEGKSAAEKLKISQSTFRLIRGAERQAAAERKQALEKSVAEQRQAAKVVQRVARQNETAQDKLNRKIRETTAAFKLAGGSPKLLRREIRGLKADYINATFARKKAFGADALSQIKTYAASFGGVGAAIAATTRELQFHAAERERISQNARSAKFGLGELAQLAATEGTTVADKEAAQKRNVAEAEAAFAAGAFTNLNEAGGTVFQLKSAGLSKADRDFAIGIRRTGALRNVGGTATAFAALETTLGKDKVGSFEDFLDQSIQASSIAPALANEIPQAAALSGGSARALGVDLPFLLAATARLGKARGSASAGGTDLASFLKQLEKALADPDVKKEYPQLVGKRGEELIDAFVALPAEARGFGGVLGDRAQAVQGGRAISLNREQLRADVAAIRRADQDNLASVTMQLPLVDPRQSASLLRQETENAREVAKTEAAIFEDLAQVVLLNQRTAREADGWNTPFDVANNAVGRARAYVNPEGFVRDSVDPNSGMSIPNEDPRIPALIEQMDRNSEAKGTQQLDELKTINELLEEIRDSGGGLTGTAG